MSDAGALAANHPLESTKEELPFRLQTESVAIGRLGPIHRALDAATGRVLLVERVDVVSSQRDAVAQVRQLIEHEIADVGGRFPGTLQYQTVVSANSALFLVSTAETQQSLARVCKEFGRLHPMVVRKCVHDLVHSLVTLHQAELYCGGVSIAIASTSLHSCSQSGHIASQLASSAILVGPNHALSISGCFPSLRTVEQIEQSGVLADPSACRTALRRPLTHNPVAQDVRGVAYVMAEMLTGRPARCSFLLDPLQVSSVHPADPSTSELQHVSFLRALAAAGSLTKDVLQHSYLRGQQQSVDNTSGALLVDNAEQRRVIAALTREELSKCSALKNEATQQIRAWFRNFEKQYDRKPTIDDCPPTIARLQARCRVLGERMTTLAERLDAVNKSLNGSASDAASEGPESIVGSHASGQNHEAASANSAGKSTSLPAAIEIDIPLLDESAGTGAERMGPRRSPAQHAFLSRLQERDFDAATTQSAP